MQRNEKRTQRHKKHRVIVCQTLCFFIKNQRFPAKILFKHLIEVFAAEMFLFSNVTCVFKAEASFVSTTAVHQAFDAFFLLQHFFCIVVEDFFGHTQHSVLCKLHTVASFAMLRMSSCSTLISLAFHQLFFNQMPSQFLDALVVIVFHKFFVFILIVQTHDTLQAMHPGIPVFQLFPSIILRTSNRTYNRRQPQTGWQ